MAGLVETRERDGLTVRLGSRVAESLLQENLKDRILPVDLPNLCVLLLLNASRVQNEFHGERKKETDHGLRNEEGW